MCVTVTPVAVLGPPFVTVIVYEYGALADTGSAESVIVMDRFTAGVTVVPAVELLLDVFGSPTLEETFAVLLIVPPADGAVTVIVISGAGPTARLDLVQVTPEPFTHVHPVPEALTYETPAGSVSVTIRLEAELGPLLLTASV